MTQLTATAVRDVQNEKPHFPIQIDLVGVRGVKRKIKIQNSDQTVFYDVEFNAFVDLPGNRRGVHMSRIIEAILEVLDEKTEGNELKELLEQICRKLLVKHPYSNRAEIEAKTTFYFDLDKEVKEAVNVSFDLHIKRDGGSEWNIGVEIEGMTVCPCAQAVFSSFEKTDQKFGLSHTQRTKLDIHVRSPGFAVPVEWLVEAARMAFSAPVLSLLKRQREYELVKAAFKNPKFIEDTVRHAFSLIIKKLSKERINLKTEVYVRGESYESVHPFNAYASKKATLEQAINELSDILTLPQLMG